MVSKKDIPHLIDPVTSAYFALPQNEGDYETLTVYMCVCVCVFAVTVLCSQTLMYTVSTKKVTPCIHCHNSDKQCQILTEF